MNIGERIWTYVVMSEDDGGKFINETDSLKKAMMIVDEYVETFNYLYRNEGRSCGCYVIKEREVYRIDRERKNENR